eukprot:19049-Heterococcus_DN1.PRE.3
MRCVHVSALHRPAWHRWPSSLPCCCRRSSSSNSSRSSSIVSVCQSVGALVQADRPSALDDVLRAALTHCADGKYAQSKGTLTVTAVRCSYRII